MSKKSKLGFYNVVMLALSSTILLMCMGTSYTMGDAKFMKECVEVAILAPTNQTEHGEFSGQVDAQHVFEIEQRHQKH
jgi:hypothetical protein